MWSGTGPCSTRPTSRSSIDRTSRSSRSLRTTASISSWLAVMPASRPTISASLAGRGALSQASSTARDRPVSSWREVRAQALVSVISSTPARSWLVSTGSSPLRWAAAQSRTARVTARIPGLAVTAS